MLPVVVLALALAELLIELLIELLLVELQVPGKLKEQPQPALQQRLWSPLRPPYFDPRNINTEKG